ncbi:DUF2723 domain-containing protein [bacterium]|nr:DUF2723 domain-containing protein [candidate division CSSED10-310 bacterium]
MSKLWNQIPGLFFILSMGVFLTGLCPGVYWGDDGLLIAASASLGIGHPPGHPLYMMVNRWALLLPFGDVAFRYNLMAAFWLSASLYLIIAWIYRKTDFRPISHLSMIALMMFTLTHLFSWHQAIRAETYSLHAFMLVLCLTSIGYAQTPRSLMAAAFFASLMIGNQLFLAALAGPGLLVIWCMKWQRMAHRPKLLIQSSFFFILGLSVYLYPVFRVEAEPAVLWTILEGPVEKFGYITARLYRNSFFGSGSTGAGFIRRLTSVFRDLFASSGYLMPVITAVTGWIGFKRSKSDAAAIAGVLVIILSTLIGTAMCAEYNIDNWDFQGYLLPVIILLPVIPALLLKDLNKILKHYRGIVLIICVIAGATPFCVSSIGGDRSLKSCFEPSVLGYANLDSVNPDCICLTRSDVGFMMIYKQTIELFRKDVTLLSRGFLQRISDKTDRVNQISGLQSYRSSSSFNYFSPSFPSCLHSPDFPKPLFWELADDDKKIAAYPARLTGSLAEIFPIPVTFNGPSGQFNRLIGLIDQKNNQRLFRDQQAVEQLSVLFFNRGTFFLNRSQADRSLVEFERAIGIDSSQARIQNNYGVALAQLNRTQDSILAFQRALILDPGHPGARRNLEMLKRPDKQ